MILFETIAVAFAMFSALPVPQPVWNDKNMRYALCAFPLVGVATSLCWWGWSALCGWLGLPMLLRAAGLCMLPAAVSGGIHLDGYADTGDALASCASPEKKKEILDDPHVKEREMFVEMDHPTLGKVTVNGCAIKLMDTKPSVRTPAPQLGQNNRDIFEGVLGMTEEQFNTLTAHSVVTEKAAA